MSDIGLYPLLDGDRCWWLAADFDGPAAMLDALAYLKAARAAGAPAALEVSRSGIGAHAWLFFTAPVPAVTARQVGTGLLREAIALRGRMDLSSYDRLFPSQDVLQTGGPGNLIAAPLQGRCRRRGTTVFLDLATLEPYRGPVGLPVQRRAPSPREVTQLATGLGRGQRRHVRRPAAGRIRQPRSPSRLPRSCTSAAGTVGITVEAADLPPPLLATLKHAASMPNPLFYERQRRRASTWDIPRFLRSYDETLDRRPGPAPRTRDRLTNSVEQAGSRLEIDRRAPARNRAGLRTSTATLRSQTQQAAPRRRAAGHDLGVLVAPPGAGKTVIACALIATHAVSTLVLVDRKTLADQWRTRITRAARRQTGQRGGGRTKTRGIIDIATLQTLARRRPRRSDQRLRPGRRR